jgi:hypothetical protein
MIPVQTFLFIAVSLLFEEEGGIGDEEVVILFDALATDTAALFVQFSAWRLNAEKIDDCGRYFLV